MQNAQKNWHAVIVGSIEQLNIVIYIPISTTNMNLIIDHMEQTHQMINQKYFIESNGSLQTKHLEYQLFQSEVPKIFAISGS